MKIIPFLLILCLCLFSSCTKELDIDPAQSLSTSEALGDLPAMQIALNGAYNGLQGISHYGRDYLVVPEVSANLVYVSFTNSGRFTGIYDYNFTTRNGYVGGVWNSLYNTILRVNNILNNVDSLEGDEEQKNQIKGEALAIRALAYFDLVRFFGRPYTTGDPESDLGVPVLLVSEIGEPSRNTVAEVYAQVISDLETAKGLLQNVGIYRFSPEAVDALLARVYLYQGAWSKAESASTALIDNPQYSLAPSFNALFANPGSSEEIFTLNFEVSESRGSNNLGAMYNPNQYGDIRVTSDLYDLYEANDSRRAMIYTENGELYQRKFIAQQGIAGLHSPKILRLAEMYLIRAEARYRQNEVDKALEDLNVIRLQRGASELTGLDNGILDIFHERQRELAFEGHTAFDLWRTGITMVRAQCNTVVQINSPCEIEASYFKTVFPIPDREMNVNPNMVQNEGY